MLVIIPNADFWFQTGIQQWSLEWQSCTWLTSSLYSDFSLPPLLPLPSPPNLKHAFFFLMKTGWILLYCMRELSTRPQGTEQGTATTAFHWVNRAQFTSWELHFLCGVSMFCVFKFPPKIRNKIENSKLPEGVNARAKVCLACYPASDILQARIERMSIF